MEFYKSKLLNGKEILDISALHDKCEEKLGREILLYMDNDKMIYPDFNPYYFAYDNGKLIGYIGSYAFDGYIIYVYPLIEEGIKANREVFDKLYDMLSYEFKYYKFETLAFPMREGDDEYKELIKSIGGYEYGKEYVMSLDITPANISALDSGINISGADKDISIVDGHVKSRKKETVKKRKIKKDKLEFLEIKEDDGEYLVLSEPTFGGLKREIGGVKVTLDNRNACISEVEISSSKRNMGYGTIMMKMLMERLYEKGFERIILQVSGNNKAAVALYKKCGFTVSESLLYMYVDEKQI